MDLKEKTRRAPLVPDGRRKGASFVLDRLRMLVVL
jgi:hypothetical protein